MLLSLGAKSRCLAPAERPLYQFHGLLSGGDELVARVLGWICLGFGALHGSLLAVGVIRYVIQVQRASRRLRSLPGYVRERLTRTCKPGTGSMTCILPATSSWSIGSSSGRSRVCLYPLPGDRWRQHRSKWQGKTAGHFKPGRERLTYRDLFSGGKSGPGGGRSGGRSCS